MSEEKPRHISLEDSSGREIYATMWNPSDFTEHKIRLVAMADGTVRWEYQ